MNDTLKAITNLIDDAVADESLDAEDLRQLGDHVWERMKEAKRIEGRKVAATLRVGSVVRIRHDAALRPRYILGTCATVVKVNQTTATITLGHVRTTSANAKFYTGQEIRCPLSALELEPDSRPKETS